MDEGYVQEESEEERAERNDAGGEATEAPTFVDDQGYIREAHVRMIRASREEDEESEESMTTDYGSLIEQLEDEADFKELEGKAHQAYRLQKTEQDVGIEAYSLSR